MENEKINQPEPEKETPIPEEEEAEVFAEETPEWKPRPLWQRIGAWVALVAFLLVILMAYINIARGG